MGYFDDLYKASPDELPSRARVVYMYLKDRAGKGQDCWPAVKTIASELVEKETRYRENGSHTSNRLILK
jgi:hypothetical protein